MTKKPLHPVLATLRESTQSVYRLMEFDHLILDHVIQLLESVDKKQKSAQVAISPSFSVETTLKSVRSVRDHNSLRPEYEQMFNQCVVLLVSHFGSAVREFLVGSIAEAIRARAMFPDLAYEQVSVRVDEITDPEADVSWEVAELLASKKNTSFQDMQSIARAFETYLGYKSKKDADTNNIIVAHACRHAFVHFGGRASDKTLAQIRDTSSRTLRVRIRGGQPVQFQPEDVRVVGDSMEHYLEKLITGVGAVLTPPLPEWPKSA